MKIKATYFLDVISSWCYWAEPAWAELQERYAEQVEFDWKVALMDKTGLPTSREQHDWFYQRSGLMMESPFKLRSEWCDHTEAEFIAPNAVARAAAELGTKDDRVRLAIAHAALREGKRVGEWEMAAAIGAEAAGLAKKELLERAQSPAIEKQLREETAEWHALQVTQRPTFVFESEIGDKAVLSGFARAGALTATLDSMIADQKAYEIYAVHFGAAPA